MGKTAAGDKKKKKEKQVEQEIDPRFDTSNKPQFRKPKSKSTKVVLDDRFSSVLTDPRFQLDIKDKYGRRRGKKQKNKTGDKEELSAFYSVQEDEVEEEEKESKPEAKKQTEEEEEDTSSSSSSDEQESASDVNESRSNTATKSGNHDDTTADKNKVEDPVSRIAYLTALSRGEVDVSSSSSDDDDDDSDEDSSDSDDSSSGENAKHDSIHGKAGILDPSANTEEVVLTNEQSPYLAVQNMDWSHVRAVDIFSIVSSFTPPGAVRRVQVFPSDFGKERLAKDALFGPVDVWKKPKKNKTDNDEEEEDTDMRLQSDSEDEPSDDKDVNNASEHDPDDVSDDETVSDGDESSPEDNQYMPNKNSETGESDFDMEKLRAYEASKLKYYFAVVEFTRPEYADIAYKEVDGMEFEHSSAAMDLRSIPVESLQDVIQNRELRDEATSIPSNYDPPEFVVCALQQSSVQCTWDLGDRGQESALTKYSASGQNWGDSAEADDLKAYLASDISSDEESDEENGKASKMRKMLGLDSESDKDEDDTKNNLFGSESSSESEEEEDGDRGDEGTKEVTFVPGKPKLSSAIGGSKPELEQEKDVELTPWEKYQEKRKQKRREKRQLARAKRKEVNELRKRGGKKSTEPSVDFFLDKNEDKASDTLGKDEFSSRTKAELELLVAGDDNDEEDRDFDMRGLERIEKNKDKKLRGARKRKEDKLAANVTGADFKIDVADDRFKAVLDGTDDRFGIDRTDPNFKETTAMREILAEQGRRRKKKRKTTTKAAVDVVVPDADAESKQSSSGAAALSALVQSIKSKVK